MKFLVDQPVSWQVARDLSEAGHDAVHVRDVGLSSARDEQIIERAISEGRAIITQDTDFGTLLAGSGKALPSVLLLRIQDGRPATQSRLLLDHLPVLEADIASGVIVVFSDGAIRVRRLPIGR